MKRIRRLLLCLAVAVVLLPMTGNAVDEGEIAGQMKEYYLSETGPQGNTFYDYDTPALPMPEAEDCRLLELPLYRQSHNFTCGVACVASVLRYAGYDFDAREDRLLMELGATPENGTNYLKIAEYLNDVRLEGFPDAPVMETEIVCEAYPSEECDGMLPRCRTAIDAGRPVICAIQAWKDDGDYSAATEDDGHYVVLIGYQKDAQRDGYLYYFMDPSTAGSYAYLLEEEFALRWHDSLDGKPTRIAIAVSYLNAEQGAPIHTAYHLD